MAEQEVQNIIDADDIVAEVNMNTGAVDEKELGEISIPSLGERKSLKDELTSVAQEGIEQERKKAAEKPAKKYKNPEARARILENEKAEREAALFARDQQIQDLQIQIERMQYEIQQRNQQQFESQEPEIDPDIDPIGAMYKKIESLTNHIQSLEQQSLTQKQQEAYVNSLKYADRLIAERIQEDPQLNQAAMQHLAQAVFEAATENLPHLTTRERLAETSRWVANQKLELLARGINPADYFFEMAKEYGFDPNAISAEDTLEGKEETYTRQDPNREAINRANRRTEKTTTIGGIDGVAPQPINPTAFKAMDDNQFNKTIDNLLKAGKVSPLGLGRKTPKLSDLLPGKGVRMS